ncbi:MAG: hypothetical protein ACXW6V_26645, partial [Candidatus Binatia bacterium]
IAAGNTQRLAHWRVGGKNHRTFEDLRGATLGTISLTAGTGLILRHPNYQLTVIAGSRAGAEKNRRLMVRFLKGYLRAIRWLMENELAATDYMTKEFAFLPEHGRRAWHYYAGNKAWDADGRVHAEGMRAVIQMMAEQNQSKGPAPAPAKYVDESYLNEALRELKEGK